MEKVNEKNKKFFKREFYKDKVAMLKKALSDTRKATISDGIDVTEIECVDEIKLSTLLTENQQETLVIMITKILQDMGEATPTLMGSSTIFTKIFRDNGVATERIIAMVELLKMLTDEGDNNQNKEITLRKKEKHKKL